MRCEVWGHSHTEKVCPYYGRARDSDQPVLQVGDNNTIHCSFSKYLIFSLSWTLKS